MTTKRSIFGTLEQRKAATETAAQSAAQERPRAQHVWVDDVDPGLLVRWRRDPDGWVGLVCSLSDTTGEPVAQWLPAARIKPSSS